MPILSIGKYMARSGDEKGFVRGQAVTFTYIPWYLAVWLGCAAAVAAFARLFWRARRSYSKGRYLVLVPGIAGVVLTVLLDWGMVRWLAPPALETVTVVLVLWRLLRIRNRLLAAFLAIVTGIAVESLNMMLLYWGLDVPFDWEIALYIMVPGGMAAGPIAGIRLALRDRVTWKRILAGLGIGFVITVGFYAIYVIRYEYFGLGESWAFVLIPFAIGGFLFTVFARWNAWARDVATGEMFRKREPGAVPPSS